MNDSERIGSADRAIAASAAEPVPVSALRAAIPCAWQPIETAPRGTRVLLWIHEPVIGYWVDALEFKTNYRGWTTGWETVSGYDVGYTRLGSPTHWMPLPEPPTC